MRPPLRPTQPYFLFHFTFISLPFGHLAYDSRSSTSSTHFFYSLVHFKKNSEHFSGDEQARHRRNHNEFYALLVGLHCANENVNDFWLAKKISTFSLRRVFRRYTCGDPLRKIWTLNDSPNIIIKNEKRTTTTKKRIFFLSMRFPYTLFVPLSRFHFFFHVSLVLFFMLFAQAARQQQKQQTSRIHVFFFSFSFWSGFMFICIITSDISVNVPTFWWHVILFHANGFFPIRFGISIQVLCVRLPCWFQYWFKGSNVCERVCDVVFVSDIMLYILALTFVCVSPFCLFIYIFLSCRNRAEF